MARPTGRPIQDELIDAATRRIQQVGVNAFSYSDLANDLGIKAPSIHHHFRTKEDLVAAVAARYRERFSDLVSGISEGTVFERLAAYADLFAQTASDDRLCLCGALSADWLTVGDKPKVEVDRFFDDQRRWLESELRQGVDAGAVRTDIAVADLGKTLLAALEGSMLMSRAGSEPDLPASVGSVLARLIAI